MRKTLLLTLFIAVTSYCYGQWVSQASGFPDPSRGINQIVAIDGNTAWATAYDGSGYGEVIQDFTTTSDGGNTWTAGTVSAAPSDYDWSCFTAADANTAWAMFYSTSLGYSGGIFKTSDGGATWTQQGAGQLFQTSSSFPDVIHFWDANNGMAMGDPANGEFEIYTTSDGGTTWNAVSGANIADPLSGEYGYTRIFAATEDVLWFATNKGRVYKTTDKGATWTAYSTGLTNATTMACKDANTCWLRYGNSLKETTDGGATWSSVLAASGHFFGAELTYVPLTANTLVSTGTNYQTGDFGSSYSLDGGLNWVTIDSAVQHIAVAFANNITGWSGGFNTDAYTDGIFKYDGGFVAVGLQELDPTAQFKIYPNPSNGLFYFSFNAENNQPITIKVTDAMGKEVFSQVYHDKSQTWLKSIDLRRFSKGIYFLTLENNGNQTSQKLVVE